MMPMVRSAIKEMYTFGFIKEKKTFFFGHTDTHNDWIYNIPKNFNYSTF